MDEAHALSAAPIVTWLLLVCFSVRGADSVREFEQICLVNPQKLACNPYFLQNSTAKLQKFCETESREAEKVSKRVENSSFCGQKGAKSTKISPKSALQSNSRNPQVLDFIFLNGKLKKSSYGLFLSLLLAILFYSSGLSSLMTQSALHPDCELPASLCSMRVSFVRYMPGLEPNK